MLKVNGRTSSTLLKHSEIIGDILSVKNGSALVENLKINDEFFSGWIEESDLPVLRTVASSVKVLGWNDVH